MTASRDDIAGTIPMETYELEQVPRHYENITDGARKAGDALASMTYAALVVPRLLATVAALRKGVASLCSAAKLSAPHEGMDAFEREIKTRADIIASNTRDIDEVRALYIARVVELNDALSNLDVGGFLACVVDPACGNCTVCRARAVIR
jgi:hypothetical protein